jgi:hypothetical protein
MRAAKGGARSRCAVPMHRDGALSFGFLWANKEKDNDRR